MGAGMKVRYGVLSWFLIVAPMVFAQPAPASSSGDTGDAIDEVLAAPRAGHAPIVVAIVVDQLAAWVLRERIDKLPADGGFARLRREGKLFQEMAYSHAITETAPGHASLFTGKLPREHGIIANDVLGPDGRKQATISDPRDASSLVTLDGAPGIGMGSSLDKLEAKADLVAEVFRSRYPKGQGLLAALSLKDRGALFAAGDMADYAIWFDAKSGVAGQPKRELGSFVTTRRYEAAMRASGLGDFVRTYLEAAPDDKRDGVERLEDQAWQGLDHAWLGENALVPGDSDYSGFLSAHLASLAPKPGAAFRALPGSDRLLLEMALHLLKHDPKQAPAFIALSLSANDYIGHLFGPDSWEAWDELRRLDANLAWFFKELDAFGPQAWSVVLSADHGAVPVEDDGRRPRCGDSVHSALDSGKPCTGSRAGGARVFLDEMSREAELAAAKVPMKDAGGAKSRKSSPASSIPTSISPSRRARLPSAIPAFGRNWREGWTQSFARGSRACMPSWTSRPSRNPPPAPTSARICWPRWCAIP